MTKIGSIIAIDWSKIANYRTTTALTAIKNKIAVKLDSDLN